LAGQTQNTEQVCGRPCIRMGDWVDGSYIRFGEPPQLVVDQRHQRLQRPGVAVAPFEQEPRDRLRFVVCSAHLDPR